MRNKPDKLGIKFWLAADAKTCYLVNGFPYLGKDATRTTGLGEHVVLKLMDPYLNAGRCVVVDNFLTGKSLAEKLLGQKITLVGTIRSNRRVLPPIAKSKKDAMERFSTQLFSASLKSGPCSLTVYKSKPTKKVSILSTKHKSIKIDSDPKKLPETIAFYNKTKFGVDVLDQKARKYSTKASSRKWPSQVFSNILDLAGINAHILYLETSGVEMPRQAFLLQLAEELCEDQISQRSDALEQGEDLPLTTTKTDGRKQCQVKLCNKNRTTDICEKCQKRVCTKCVSKVEFTCKLCAH